MDLRDYLDSLSPEEKHAWSEGPDALIQAKAKPFTMNAGLGADVVFRPTSQPSASTTLAPTPMVYGGSPTISPTSTVPVDSTTWRRTVSTAALNLATAVANVIRSYPASPVTTALFVTPLRNFGWLVIDPARMTVENARSTLNAMSALLTGASFVSAGGAAELRAGLDRLMAMIPRAASTPFDVNPSVPGGGGFGPSVPGPSTVPGGGGGPGPGPSTSGCPTNASPVAGGCACDPGFVPNATLDACVPASSTYVPPPPTPTSSGARGGSMGWFLLLGGAALAYRALK